MGKKNGCVRIRALFFKICMCPVGWQPPPLKSYWEPLLQRITRKEKAYLQINTSSWKPEPPAAQNAKHPNNSTHGGGFLKPHPHTAKKNPQNERYIFIHLSFFVYLPNSNPNSPRPFEKNRFFILLEKELFLIFFGGGFISSTEVCGGKGSHTLVTTLTQTGNYFFPRQVLPDQQQTPSTPLSTM